MSRLSHVAGKQVMGHDKIKLRVSHLASGGHVTYELNKSDKGRGVVMVRDSAWGPM